MSLNLGPEVQHTVWDQLDWSSAAPQLGEALIANDELEPRAKASLLRQIAQLCDFCVLDPQSAADFYGASFQLDRSQVDLLSRMRHLCHSMGRTDHAARTAELEFRQSQDPRFHAIAGQAWLDAGKPDRALKPLLLADKDCQDDPHVLAALEVARREWSNPEAHAETLLARAQSSSSDSAIAALKAARIFRMLDLVDERYEQSLCLCLQEEPNHPSACRMYERFLFGAERLDELAQHFQARARAATSSQLAANALLEGSSLLFRAEAGKQGGPLFVAGLKHAADANLTSIPGLLAQLRGLVASAAPERQRVVELAEQAYPSLESIDEQVGVAIFCVQIATHAQRDPATASQWLARLKEHDDEHPLLSDSDIL